MTVFFNVLVVVVAFLGFYLMDREYRREIKRLGDELDAAYSALGALREEQRTGGSR